MLNKLQEIFLKLSNVDRKSAKFLVEALSKNNLQGFDYLEYKQSLDALEALNIGEDIAFKSAFATAATMGLTKGKLLETANYYKKILAQEENKFEQALQAQTVQKVASKQKEMVSHQKAIEQKQEKIKQLQMEIDRHVVKMEEVQKDIESSKYKIFAAKENFEKTFNAISGEIDDDIDKIKSYIG